MKRFCFDTSAFLEPWKTHYPPDIVRPLWDQIETFGKDGVVVAPEQVLRELSKYDDPLSSWAKDHAHIFKAPTEAVQRALRDVMRTHPGLVSIGKNRSGADPWVIAQARVSAAVVVTYEGPEPNRRQPKIPEVCLAYKIPCLTFVDFLRDVNIQFRLA